MLAKSLCQDLVLFVLNKCFKRKQIYKLWIAFYQIIFLKAELAVYVASRHFTSYVCQLLKSIQHLILGLQLSTLQSHHTFSNCSSPWLKGAEKGKFTVVLIIGHVRHGRDWHRMRDCTTSAHILCSSGWCHWFCSLMSPEFTL